ncbi:Pesticin receptor [Zhongshania aliphaticivorans]|uniref:Pesticin receptor n=1 Tax=Zhongshania aliphaticivorans TaxID=1470434 RepID=A0A5S9MRT8_9GAMM|nr:TonB-dependent receptor [Zhongshania aliphaticivorans]CAA0079507.1 Pesticin receptor [Zhongshania aliphaticivorans]CAA0086112.1 Pesticin receptor [Zhongshania aliphaticivorans]
MSTFQRPFLGMLAGSFLLSPLSQAIAQTESFMLEEVLVTSQKREQSLQDVPASVQAMSGDMLENAGITDFEDLVDVSPSLSFQDNLSPYQKSVYIRGVGTTINSATVESSVSTVLDGVVLARQGQFFSDLADIERVEVLRGPQSTLFGKNASAGVISIVTKRPTFEEPEGNVGVGYDEYGDARLKGTYSAPISDDLAFRVSGNYRHVDENHIQNITPDGPSLDGAESYGVRAKLQWDITPEIDVLFIADYTDSDSPSGARVSRSLGPEQAAISAATAGVGNRETELNDPNEHQITDWGLSAEINWRLENHTITSLTSYRSWDLYDLIDIDSTGFDVPLTTQIGANGPLGTPSFRGIVTGDKDTEQWSEELRIQSDHSGDLQYVVGAFFWGTSYDGIGTSRRTFCFDAPTPDGYQRPSYSDCEPLPAPYTSSNFIVNDSYSSHQKIDTEYYALFGQADYSLADDWILTLGLRYQYDNFAWDAEQLGVLVAGDTLQEGYEGTGDVSNNEWTGKLAIQHDFNGESNGYISYSRGYKGPGASIDSGFEAPLEPEYVDAYELGFKSRLMDGRLNINTAVFWQEFKDQQVNYYNPDELGWLPTNAGETRQIGIEFDSLFAASANLVLNASLTWLDAEYLEYEVDCYTSDPDPQCSVNGSKDVSGEVTTFSPEWKTIIGGRYHQPLFDSGLEGFVQLNYRWQSEVQYDANQNPNTLQDAYGVADLSFGFEDEQGKYLLSFFVNNLFDKQYVSNIAAFSDATGQYDSVIQFVPKSADRYFSMNFNYNF